MNLYVATCDKYLHLIKPFMWFYNRYNNDVFKNVKILGYKEPDFDLKENFEFISLGIDKGYQEWSTELINYFNSIKDKYFAFCTEDMFLVKPIDKKILTFIQPYNLALYTSKTLGRIGLTNDLRLKDNDKIWGISKQGKHYAYVIRLTPTANYKISCLWSIWNREYFLKYLEPHKNAWQFELDGSTLAKNDEYDVLGTSDNYAVYQTVSIRKGNINNLNYNIINTDDKIYDDIIQQMKEEI